MDDNNKPFRIGRWQWALYALVAALIIASIMRGQSGDVPAWQQCKESLFNQMFSDQCTPRRGFAPNNQSGEQPEGLNLNTNGRNI